MTYIEGRRKYSCNPFACRRYKELNGQHDASAALTAVKTRYPSYRRLGGPRCRFGRVRKISTAPGFVLQTSKDVASCRTDCAVPAANEYGLLNSWKSVTIKVRMMVVFCHGHMHVLRALSFFANVPYEMCLFVIRFTRGQVRGRGGAKKVEATLRWKLHNELAMTWVRCFHEQDEEWADKFR